MNPIHSIQFSEYISKLYLPIYFLFPQEVFNTTLIIIKYLFNNLYFEISTFVIRTEHLSLKCLAIPQKSFLVLITDL